MGVGWEMGNFITLPVSNPLARTLPHNEVEAGAALYHVRDRLPTPTAQSFSRKLSNEAIFTDLNFRPHLIEEF